MVPSFIPPQLLRPGRTAPAGDGWLHEVKFDGYRLHARLESGRARLLTRRGNDWTAHFPRIAAGFEALGIADAYVDGEVVVLDAEGRPDFAALRSERGFSRAVYQAFDLLFLGGRDLLGADVLIRKQMLRALVGQPPRSPCLRYTDHLLGRGPDFFAAVQRMRLEGIVSKRLGSGYQPGARSPDWLKVKAFERYRLRVAAVGPTSARVTTEEGVPLGEVALGRWQPRPGELVEVRALPVGAVPELRHATILRVIPRG